MTDATLCRHLYAPHESRGRRYVACLGCGQPKPEPQEKPPEPCFFVESGEADRARMEDSK